MAFGLEPTEHRDHVRGVFKSGATALNAEVCERTMRAMTLEWAVQGDPALDERETAAAHHIISTTLAAVIDLLGEADLAIVPREYTERHTQQSDSDDDWDV